MAFHSNRSWVNKKKKKKKLVVIEIDCHICGAFLIILPTQSAICYYVSHLIIHSYNIVFVTVLILDLRLIHSQFA